MVCVLWSRHSVVSDWVAEEAEWGRERGALCPALIDQVRPPLGLGSVQAANLVGWKGARRDPAWQYFIECIRARLEGKALPERKPPKPRTPVLPIVGGVLAAAAALLSIGATLEQMGVIDLLKNWPTVAANARQATATEAAEWTSIQQSHDCAAIAQYLRSNPGGVFAGEAQALLAAKQTIAEPGWEPYQQAGWTTGASSLEDRRSREAACAAAQAAAQRNATSSCSVYDADGAHRQSTGRVQPAECSCSNQALDLGAGQTPASWTCTVRAPSVCSGEVRRQTSREICGG